MFLYKDHRFLRPSPHFLNYHNFRAVSTGAIHAEAGYKFAAGPAAIYIPASFDYDLGSSAYHWSSGLAVDFNQVHLAAGFGGWDTTVFKDLNVELSTSLVENADIYAIADFDFSTTTAFQSVDLGAKYNFGAFGLGAGYVVAADDATTTILWGDNNSMTGSGMYLYADIDL